MLRFHLHISFSFFLPEFAVWLATASAPPATGQYHQCQCPPWKIIIVNAINIIIWIKDKKELKAIFSWDCLLSSLHIILEQFTMLKLGESRSRCRLLGDHYQTYWSIMRTMNILSLVFFIIHCQHYDQVSRVIYDKDPVTTMCTNCRTTVTTIVTAEVNTHYQHRHPSHFHHHNNVHLHCCLDRLVWSLGLLQGLAVLQVISSSVKKVLGPDTNKNI